MPVNSIINNKSDYYIAMYSAHASIIENLIGTNGHIKKILIDSGGLKAPKGSFKNKSIFSNYYPELHKTLHAKIIYLTDKNKVSLWTGNLRNNTLSKQENIIITKSINDHYGNKIKTWFNQDKKGQLIFKINGDCISDVEISNKNIWDSFSKSITKVIKNIDGQLSLHTISPWGSCLFVEKVNKIFLPYHNIKLHLYTRPCHEDSPIWIDALKKNEAINRYVWSNIDSFPHYKCVFLTCKSNGKERIIWSYIGSANLTNKAFFNNGNIEYAAFFENPILNKELEQIFKNIVRRSNWHKRIPLEGKSNELDDSIDNNCEYEDNNNGFMERKFSKALCKKLSEKKHQKYLDDAYQKSKKYKIIINNDIFNISVVSIHHSIFDLNISCRNILFSLAIKRIANDEIFSDNGIKGLMNMLLSKETSVESMTNQEKSNEKNSNNYNIIQKRNIRFPIERILIENNIHTLNQKKSVLFKLNKEIKRLNSTDSKIVSMWSQIIKEL